MATRTLARWATQLESASLPTSVKKAAARSLYNYIGCAIGGSSHPAVAKAYAALAPFFGPPTSNLYGSRGGRKVDAQHAALLNGIASHVHDYDDTHLATIIHPTGPVASALLAYAEYKGSISGPDILLALTAGIEASCKIGLAVWPEHYDIGWHITSSTGQVGAAVAVGKVMGLSEEQMAHAIGIAATQVVGLREFFGSDTKSFHPGRAAQSGLLAALLAERGYTSTPQALEAKRGWANVVAGGGTPKLDKYLSELGQKWEIEANAFKPFPCGIVIHPAIDGAIQMHQEFARQGTKLDEIEKVELKVHPLVLELTSKRKPRDGLEAKFSVFHGVAVGLLYGKAGPAQYADDVVTDPMVVGIRDKVDAVAGKDLAADEVFLTLTLKSGSKLEKHVEHAVGSLEVPMIDDQLHAKFIDQSALVLGQQAREASDNVWKLGDASDVVTILQSL
ncbi:mmge/prpd family protein-like protein [Teratosphaeria nubilosa]|uniref:Mmge/prpd family protein-like protein n=1 Tax=Teratosphaeria nubilosa TaxID=161662 RepID=A0A6G1LBS0_9PEZI|nr:mmge/prpd family protein-like protein [Teratosphaeria nubilosa]